MKERYSRNIPALSEDDMIKILDSSICVVGAGGLGGYIIEEFIRIGIGSITVVDDDHFCESNLNRQLFSVINNMGESKCEAAEKRIGLVNPEVEVKIIKEKLTKENAELVLGNHDIIIDAVDNIETRIIISEACDKIKKPLMHGAIGSWHLQAMLIMPGSGLMEKIYSQNVEPTKNSTLAFTPAICASVQVAETTKYLCGKKCQLEGRMLYMDVENMDVEIIDFN